MMPKPTSAKGQTLRDLDSRILDRQTLLVVSALYKISDLLEENRIPAKWNAKAATAKVSFVGKNGKECEFHTRIELVKPLDEPHMYFSFTRGNAHGTDMSGTPTTELTPEKIVAYFRRVFALEI